MLLADFCVAAVVEVDWDKFKAVYDKGQNTNFVTIWFYYVVWENKDNN